MMDDRNWLGEVILAVRKLGDEASLQQIYKYIQSRRRTLPPEWQAAIRATIYHHSSDSPARQPHSPDVFYKAGRGIWGLRHPDDKLYSSREDHIETIAILAITPSELEDALKSNGDKGFEELLKTKVQAIKDRYRMS